MSIFTNIKAKSQERRKKLWLKQEHLPMGCRDKKSFLFADIGEGMERESEDIAVLPLIKSLVIKKGGEKCELSESKMVNKFSLHSG